jgi:hypothetical protein
VQWYASDAGVDLDIAEREIVLAYVLRILADQGLLEQLAFKGGTAIRKIHLANQGRFSLDLDFTALGEVESEDLILNIVGALHNQTHYGLRFSIPASDFYTAQDSCGAEVTYQHAWVKNGNVILARESFPGVATCRPTHSIIPGFSEFRNCNLTNEW